MGSSDTVSFDEAMATPSKDVKEPKASNVVSFDEAMGTKPKAQEKPAKRYYNDRNPELTDFVKSSGKAINDYEHQSMEHPYDSAKGLVKATVGGIGDIEDLVVQGLSGLANSINEGSLDSAGFHQSPGAFERGQQKAKNFRTSSQHLFSKIMDLNMAPENKSEKAASDLLGILGNVPHTAGATVFEDTGSALLGASVEGASSVLLLFSPAKLAKMFKRGIDPAHAVPGASGSDGPGGPGGGSAATTPLPTETGTPGAHVAEKFNELAMTDPATADKIADRVSKADPELGQKMKMRVKMKTSHAKKGLEPKDELTEQESFGIAMQGAEDIEGRTNGTWVHPHSGNKYIFEKQADGSYHVIVGFKDGNGMLTTPVAADGLTHFIHGAEKKAKEANSNKVSNEEAQIQGKDSAAASVLQDPGKFGEKWLVSIHDKETGELKHSFSFFNKDAAEDSAKGWGFDHEATVTPIEEKKGTMPSTAPEEDDSKSFFADKDGKLHGEGKKTKEHYSDESTDDALTPRDKGSPAGWDSTPEGTDNKSHPWDGEENVTDAMANHDETLQGYTKKLGGGFVAYLHKDGKLVETKTFLADSAATDWLMSKIAPYDKPEDLQKAQNKPHSPQAMKMDSYIKTHSDVDNATQVKRSGVKDNPAFQKWFGKSEVVDKNGDPTIMYHGTGSDIFIFKRGHNGDAIFVSPSSKVAHDFTKGENPVIYPLYVRAENPFDFNKQEHLDELTDAGIDRNTVRRVADGTWSAIESAKVQDVIKANKHDGYYTIEYGAKNLGVYDRSQLKSAVGNRGEYSRFDPNIHASVDSPLNDLWGNLQNRHGNAFKKGDTLSGKTLLDKFIRSIPQGKELSSKALYQGELLRRLSKAVGNVPIKFVDKLDYVIDHGDGKRVRESVNGLYHPNHTIEVVTNGKMVETAIHELTHAATIRFLRDNPDHPVTKEMNRLFGVAKERLARSGEEAPYGMTNVEEFIAEAMSSKHFQEWLIRSERWAGIDEGLGVWNKFAHLVQRILGLSARAAPLLHGVLHNTGEIFKEREFALDRPQPNLVSAGMKEATKGAHAAWGPPEEPVKKNIALGKIQEYSRQIVSVLNPRAVGRGAQVAATYIMSGYAEAMQKAIQMGKESQKREAAWNKRLDQVRDFLKGYESGKTFADPFLREMQERYKKWNEDIHAQDQRNGLKAYEPQEHYLYHAYKSGPKIPIEQFLRQKFGTKWADPGFTKERGFEMYEEAIKAGYVPKFENPEQLMQARQYASDIAEMRVNLLKNLESAGYAVDADKVKDPPKGYGASQRRSPNGSHYWIHPDSEVVMHNAFDTASLWTSKGMVGDAYRGLMELKNTIVPIRLAGLFHINHVGLGIDSASAVARGVKEVLTGHNPITAIGRIIKTGTPILSSFILNPLRGGRLRSLYRGEIPPHEMTLADKEFLRNAIDGGFVPYMDRRWLTSASAKFKEAIAKHNYGRAGLRLVPHLISQLNKPIFEMWIPALKAASYEQEMGTLFRVNPELLKPENDIQRRVALSKLSIHIDERFGEMATNNMFWPKWLKDIMVLNTLSIGWQKGFISQFGGGALEAAGAVVHPIEKLKGGELDRALFATAYTGIALGLTGLMSYGLSGKPPEGEDYIWPRNGQTNPDGTPQRVGTVFFTREFGSLYKHTQLEGVFSALKDIAASKGSGIAGLIASAASGKDDLHRDIRSADAPWYQQAEQTAAYMIGDVEPISVQKGGDTTRDKVLSVLGSNPAPKYATEPYAESKIKQIYYTYHAPGETSYEKSQQNADAKTYLQMRNDRDSGAAGKLSEMKEKYKLSPGQVKSLVRAGSMREPIDIYMFKQLTWQEQVRILKDSNVSEEDKEKYLKKARTQTKQAMKE